jgi:hypothetical protein
MVPIHRGKPTGGREVEGGHEQGWGGYVVASVLKVVDLLKDFEETWAWQGDEVGVALVVGVGADRCDLHRHSRIPIHIVLIVQVLSSQYIRAMQKK